MSSSHEGCSDNEEVKRSFKKRAKEIDGQLLPKKSKKKYLQSYDHFRGWLSAQNSNSFDESRFQVYFKELSANYNPATLWSKWSMLRGAMLVKHGIDLHQYKKVKAFVKRQSAGYRPNKAATFSYRDIKRFIDNAPDVIYLAMKVWSIYFVFFFTYFN